MSIPGLKNRRQMLGLSGGLWTIGLLISFLQFGVLDSLLNPFRWWLSFKEVIEFLLFVPTNIEILAELFASPFTQEQIYILMGIPGLLAWFIGLVTIYKLSDSRFVKLAQGVGTFLFWPLLGLLSIGTALRRLEA